MKVRENNVEKIFDKEFKCKEIMRKLTKPFKTETPIF